MRLRPISSGELQSFAATATDPGHVDAIRAYIDDQRERGALRPEWCFIAERDGSSIGRAALWGLPKAKAPSDIILFDLPWTAADSDAIGSFMLKSLSDLARHLGARTLGHVVDTPEQAPQWQGSPERRAAALKASGFKVRRETLRFEFDPATPVRSAAMRLAFRSMADVGEPEFRAATMRVTEGTLDRRVDGEIFAIVKALDHDPSWWELAYDDEGALVGLIMPTLAPGFATIGFMGVVPEMRGRRHVDELLARATETLVRTCQVSIQADADTGNTPMANAFRRGGWRQFAIRTEYERRLAT